MRVSAGWATALATTLLAALPAGAAAQATVAPSSVSDSARVPAGGARSLTLACPSTAVALHAAPVRLPNGVRVAGSAPGENPRRWSFRFASAARSTRKVTAMLRCVRLRLPSGVSNVTVGVSTTSRSGLQLPAASSVEVALRCASGHIPAGQGVGASTRAVSLAAAVPMRRGWLFRIENHGDAPARASVHIRCLQRVASGRRNGTRTRLAFKVRHATFSVRVRSGIRSFTGSCGRNRFSLGTGISLDRRDDIALLRSFPSGSRDGSWFLRNGGPPERVRGYLLCLARDSLFRSG